MLRFQKTWNSKSTIIYPIAPCSSKNNRRTIRPIVSPVRLVVPVSETSYAYQPIIGSIVPPISERKGMLIHKLLVAATKIFPVPPPVKPTVIPVHGPGVTPVLKQWIQLN